MPVNYTGSLGPNGAKGSQGPPGIDGEPGPRGPPGTGSPTPIEIIGTPGDPGYIGKLIITNSCNTVKWTLKNV